MHHFRFFFFFGAHGLPTPRPEPELRACEGELCKKRLNSVEAAISRVKRSTSKGEEEERERGRQCGELISQNATILHAMRKLSATNRERAWHRASTVEMGMRQSLVGTRALCGQRRKPLQPSAPFPGVSCHGPRRENPPNIGGGAVSLGRLGMLLTKSAMQSGKPRSARSCLGRFRSPMHRSPPHLRVSCAYEP